MIETLKKKSPKIAAAFAAAGLAIGLSPTGMGEIKTAEAKYVQPGKPAHIVKKGGIKFSYFEPPATHNYFRRYSLKTKAGSLLVDQICVPERGARSGDGFALVSTGIAGNETVGPSILERTDHHKQACEDGKVTVRDQSTLPVYKLADLQGGDFKQF